MAAESQKKTILEARKCRQRSVTTSTTMAAAAAAAAAHGTLRVAEQLSHAVTGCKMLSKRLKQSKEEWHEL